MALTQLDSFAIDHPGSGDRTMQFMWGDLTQLGPQDAVDVLVVSAQPGNYSPTPGTLIGALSQAGVSVAQLAQNKAANYEPTMPCWISQPVQSSSPGIRFNRILVYEPANEVTTAAPLAWTIFQALACFYGTTAVRVAMPLVCSGLGHADPKPVLLALAWAGAHWGSSNATRITNIKIATYGQQQGQTLEPSFAALKSSYLGVFGLPLPNQYAEYVDGAQREIGGRILPPTITTRQAVALCIYTTEYHFAINSTIRSYQPSDPAYQAMFPLFEAIDSGLANVTPYIGTSKRGENLGNRRPQYQPGAQITNLAYTSSSISHAFPGPDQININGRTAGQIDPYSEYMGEGEALFGRNLVFRVDTRNCTANTCTFGVTQLVTNWCGV